MKDLDVQPNFLNARDTIAYLGGVYVIWYGTVHKDLMREVVLKDSHVSDSLNVTNPSHVLVKKVFVMLSVIADMEMMGSPVILFFLFAKQHSAS